MPPGVADVRIAGAWDRNGKTGLYRLVVMRGSQNPVTARLFVQWIAVDKKGAATMEKSLEIKEVADLKADIADLSADAAEDGLTVFVTTADSAGDPADTYEVVINGPDKYRFGPTSN